MNAFSLLNTESEFHAQFRPDSNSIESLNFKLANKRLVKFFLRVSFEKEWKSNQPEIRAASVHNCGKFGKVLKILEFFEIQTNSRRTLLKVEQRVHFRSNVPGRHRELTGAFEWLLRAGVYERKRERAISVYKSIIHRSSIQNRFMLLNPPVCLVVSYVAL